MCVTFYDAGHALGSAVTVLDVEEHGKTRRVVFTGDLGRHERPILRDPEIAQDADALITESSQGDRVHDSMERERRADVILNGFSAHADPQDLLAHARKTREKGPLEQVILVHGNPRPQGVLRGLLPEAGHDDVATPAAGGRIESH